MSRLLSGSVLRSGGSGEFIRLEDAQPQLPPTDTTATGFTLITDSLLRTSYSSSLGFVEFNNAQLYSSLPDGTIRILATGTSLLSLSTNTGNLVIQGGVGVGANMYIGKDIVVNGLTIGRGYEGKNNIVIKGVAEPQLDEFNNGQQSIAIGYDALGGLTTSYKDIALGRYALGSGTNVSNSIAIGDSSLRSIGYYQSLPVANVTNISNTNPIIVTANGHNLTSGTNVTLLNVSGMTEVNNQNYYVGIVSNNQVSLYSDLLLTTSIDGTGFGSYSSGGTLERILLKNNNIAIGTNAGKNLIDGEKNFFFGDGIATNLTTGSNNFFIGHDVGQFITRGNNIIAIGGDNLVDNLDNQVNIGSVFYYDGLGNLQLNSNGEIGLGTSATITPPKQFVFTSTYTAGLVVIGGLVVTENMIINKTIEIITNIESDDYQSGSLIVAGGVGIGNSLNVNNKLTVEGTGTVSLQPTLSGTVTIYPQDVVGSIDNMDIGLNDPRDGNFLNLTALELDLTATTSATSTTTGALVVAGGAGIGGDLYVGGNIFGPDGQAIDGRTNIVYITTASTASYYIALTNNIGTLSNVLSTTTFYYDGLSEELFVQKLNITSTLSDTSTNINQAAVINGGIYVNKGIYSDFSGAADENYLVYTPVVTVSTTTPVNPRVGDFWIEPNLGVEFQYIKDGSSKIWIQFTGL
jgi:hypothetical protein